jgi:hypothetical protein
VVEEMIDILDELNKYVPASSSWCVDGKMDASILIHKIHKILFTGDMLTRKRAETAKESRKNGLTLMSQFE